MNCECKKTENGILSEPKECRGCELGEDFDKILEKIKNFINDYKRIPYPIITAKIFDSDSEVYENLYITLDGLIEYSINNKRDEDDEEIINELLRLRDHVELANAQSTVINKAKEAVVKNIKNDINDLNSKVNNANEHFSEMEEKTNEISKELIGIVAIFVGIAFVMFGGVNLINSLFANVNSKSLMPLCCLGSLFGIVIIEALYYFSMMVFKLSGLSQNSGEGGKTLAQKAERYLFIFTIITFCLNFLGVDDIGNLIVISSKYTKILSSLWRVFIIVGLTVFIICVGCLGFLMINWTIKKLKKKNCV